MWSVSVGGKQKGHRRRNKGEGDEARDWETREWHQQPEGKEKGSQGHDDGLEGKNVVEKRHTEKKRVSGSATERIVEGNVES